MAARKPIIASNLDVICEILENKENALLCDPEDIRGWVDSLALLVRDNALGDRLQNSAYQKLINYYTWEQRADRVLL